MDVRQMDKELLKQPFVNGNWHVHSLFQKSFNLQSDWGKQLLVISNENLGAPHGMVIDKTDYQHLTASLRPQMPVFIRHRIAYFPQHQLSFQQAKLYPSSWEETENIFKQGPFLTQFGQLKKQTGFNEALAESTSSTNDFLQAVDQLCSRDGQSQRQGSQFLLGRGIGLTPTGDDMLVGHLFARLVLAKEAPKLIRFLVQKLQAVEDVTTDISLHYLLCALNGFFSRSILQLAVTAPEEWSEALEKVLQTGHTSGADFLSGFARSLQTFEKIEKEEKLWQNE